MKFEVTKKALVTGLKKVSSCSERKSIAQSGIMEIKLENKKRRLLLKKNNLENCIISAVGASIIEEDPEEKAVYVQCQELLDIVNLMPEGQITITTGKSVVVSAGKTKMSLPVSSEPFAGWEKEPTIAEAVLPEVVFKNLVEKVAYSSASDKEQSFRIMSSVHVEIKDDVLTMTATDGKRVAKASAEIKATGHAYNCLIPAKQLSDISSLLSDMPGDDMSFIMTKNGYMMRVTDKTVLICGRFINGVYPTTVQTVLDVKTENLIEVDREELCKAVDRAAYVSKRGDMRPMTLDIGNTLKLSSKNVRNEVEDEIFCNIKGKPMKVGVDPTYLREMLRRYPDDRVTMGYTSPKDPILLYTSGQGQTLVVFPVLLRDE